MEGSDQLCVLFVFLLYIQKQTDAAEAAEEEIAIYRQPMGAQERYARASSASGGGGKVSFYPTYRFGSVRLISPYALQHLLASRFQNADYPGKSHIIV